MTCVSSICSAICLLTSSSSTTCDSAATRAIRKRVRHAADHERQHEEDDEVGELFGLGEIDAYPTAGASCSRSRSRTAPVANRLGPSPRKRALSGDRRGEDQSVGNAAETLKEKGEHEPDRGQGRRAEVARRVRNPVSWPADAARCPCVRSALIRRSRCDVVRFREVSVRTTRPLASALPADVLGRSARRRSDYRSSAAKKS